MKKLIAGILAAFTLLSASAVLAHDFKAGNTAIKHPWARATIGQVKNGAAFFTLHNMGEGDRLLGVASPVAKIVQLHNHIMTDGVMKMRRVEGGIEIPAGGNVTLKPGGYHVMMMGLHAPLKEGEKFPMTLSFEKAGEIEVTVVVQGAGSMEGAHNGGHDMQNGEMDGHNMDDHSGHSN